MLARTKKHPIDGAVEILWHGGRYSVPIDVMERYKIKSTDTEYTSIEDLFGHLTQETGEPAVLLRGVRHKEGLTQREFSKQLNISQTNLSAMENGRRAIGKELAKRIAAISGLDYRIFL